MSALKNLYNKELFQYIGKKIKECHPSFNQKEFEARIYDDEWENRELKARTRHTTLSLRPSLPDDYAEALKICLATAENMKKDKYDNYALTCFPDFVEVYGLNDIDISIPALAQLTSLVSSEFAVRPFIEKYPKRMYQSMLEWTQSKDVHIRRLASEGIRPRLPWGRALVALKKDPAPILPILEQLKNDPELYVRRSVANNLNDIAKDHPKIVLQTLQKWQQQPTPEIQWITKHATRTLIKAGHQEALQLLGFSPNPEVQVTDFEVDKSVIQMGDSFTFSFNVISENKEKTQALVIDYAMHFTKANGSTSPKVFKLLTKKIAPNETISISKKHSIRPITTRKYYAGKQLIEIKINGVSFGKKSIELEC